MEPPPDAVPAVRRRRRAVGPPGAGPAQEVGAWPVERDEPLRPGDDDDDARLRADVPPHHGGH